MRFRTTVTNVPTFFKLIQAVEKLQKKCIIKFTPEHMSVICNHEANEGGIQVWSQVKIEALFDSYRIQSNANNEITMLLSTEALLGALRSGSGSGTSGSTFETEEMVIKLAKKNDQALLAFEIKSTSRVGNELRVNHDLKIEVLRPADVEKLKEPLCPEPDVHILLPPLPKLRTIVDRLRSMSDVLSVRANRNKHLQLAIHTESVRVDVDWKDCTHPQTTTSDDEPQEEVDIDAYFGVMISTKSFLKFLNSHVVSTTTIASICQHHCVILYVYIGDVADAGGVLTYYIPALIGDDG